MIAIVLWVSIQSIYVPRSEILRPETEQAIERYRVCVINAARGFESSGQPISDIVAASITSCDQQRLELGVYVSSDVASDAVHNLNEAATGRYSQDSPDPEEMMRAIDDRVEGQARLELVRMRTPQGNH